MAMVICLCLENDCHRILMRRAVHEIGFRFVIQKILSAKNDLLWWFTVSAICLDINFPVQQEFFLLF